MSQLTIYAILLLASILHTSYACNQLNIELKPFVIVNITSPGYPNPYPNYYKTCKFTGFAPRNYRINFYCDFFDLNSSASCLYTHLAFSPTGDDHYYDANRYCGRKKSLILQTTGNYFAIKFKNYLSNIRGNIGFRCYVEAVPFEEYSITATTTPSSAVAASTTSSPTSVTTASPTLLPAPAATNCSCGVRGGVQLKIVGGNRTNVNEYPWMAALLDKRYGHQFCGGSLISNQWILTASHCTHELKASIVQVVLGEHDLSLKNESASTKHSISQIIMHERYNTANIDNDIALLKLTFPVKYSAIVSPVCLPYRFQDNAFHGKTGIVAGWGTTSSSGVASKVLQQVKLPILLNKECRKFPEIRKMMTDNMICTYLKGKDSCQGDSGGPLVYEANGRIYQIGIVSWGLGCADKGRPGVYTKLNNYLSWIQAKIGKTLCNK